MKKTVKLFLCGLIIFCLSACQKDPKPQDNYTDKNEEKEEFIDPVRDIFIFEQLDKTLAERLKEANGNKDLQNYQFKMLFNDQFDIELTDINGNAVSLGDYDQFFFEIASVECSHCRKELHIIDAFKEENDIPFIQYFDVGDAQEIRKIYEEEGLEIKDDQIILVRNDNLHTYFKELGLKAYPTLVTYKDHKISFVGQGSLDLIALAKVKEVGFNDPIKEEDLCNEEGRSYLELSRSVDDVKKDLSKENLAALKVLDNDDYTEDVTLKLMGKKVDLSKSSNHDNDSFINEVKDFTKYEDKKLVLLYTYLKDIGDTDKIEFINELIEGDNETEYVVVLVEGFESVSNFIRQMPRFNCPMISTLSALPDDLYGFGIIDYPTALFVDKGTITGVYSHVENKEKFEEAKRLFLSDECIAYKKNNQIVNG